jgi:hypothetical protein
MIPAIGERRPPVGKALQRADAIDQRRDCAGEASGLSWNVIGKSARRFPQQLLLQLLLLRHGKPGPAPAIDPYFRLVFGEGLLRHLCPEHRPGARDDAVEVISATAQGYPAAMTRGIALPSARHCVFLR